MSFACAKCLCTWWVSSTSFTSLWVEALLPTQLSVTGQHIDLSAKYRCVVSVTVLLNRCLKCTPHLNTVDPDSWQEKSQCAFLFQPFHYLIEVPFSFGCLIYQKCLSISSVWLIKSVFLVQLAHFVRSAFRFWILSSDFFFQLRRLLSTSPLTPPHPPPWCLLWSLWRWRWLIDSISTIRMIPPVSLFKSFHQSIQRI